MRFPLLTRCRVPASLEEVTALGAEARPRDLGVSRKAVARIWAAVERLYASGLHPAIQLCVRRHGQVLIDRAIGHARGNGPDDPLDAPRTRVTTATPFNIFSAAKAVTAMVIHLLTSGKPLVYPQLYYLWDVVRQIGRACRKERAQLHPAGVAAAAQRSLS